VESYGPDDRRRPGEPAIGGEAPPPAEEQWPALVEENLIAFFQHAARARPSGKLIQPPGLVIAASGARFYMFNAAFLAEPLGEDPSSLSARIREAAGWLNGHDDGWSFWVCEHKCPALPPHLLQQVFRRNGLSYAYRHPGMAAAELAPPRIPPPPLEIRPVASRETRAAFSHINAHAFRVPFEWCLELYGVEALWTEKLWGWVGYRNGAAIATAAILQTGAVAGLYSVATLPEFQRQGAGETMVRYAVEWARRERGASLSVLQSTREGEPLYRRLGYRTVTYFSVFAA